MIFSNTPEGQQLNFFYLGRHAASQAYYEYERQQAQRDPGILSRAFDIALFKTARYGYRTMRNRNFDYERFLSLETFLPTRELTTLLPRYNEKNKSFTYRPNLSFGTKMGISYMLSGDSLSGMGMTYLGITAGEFLLNTDSGGILKNIRDYYQQARRNTARIDADYNRRLAKSGPGLMGVLLQKGKNVAKKGKQKINRFRNRKRLQQLDLNDQIGKYYVSPNAMAPVRGSSADRLRFIRYHRDKGTYGTLAWRRERRKFEVLQVWSLQGMNTLNLNEDSKRFLKMDMAFSYRSWKRQYKIRLEEAIPGKFEYPSSKLSERPIPSKKALSSSAFERIGKSFENVDIKESFNSLKEAAKRSTVGIGKRVIGGLGAAASISYLGYKMFEQSDLKRKIEYGLATMREQQGMEFGSGYVSLTNAAKSERQRALEAMQYSSLNARSLIGTEAAQFHSL